MGLCLFSSIHSAERSSPDAVISFPQASSAQYLKLSPDGHLKLFEWKLGVWTVVADVLTHLGECGYPFACGKNAICSGNKSCSCPMSNYFKQLTGRQGNYSYIICSNYKYHEFIKLENIEPFISVGSIDTNLKQYLRSTNKHVNKIKLIYFT